MRIHIRATNNTTVFDGDFPAVPRVGEVVVFHASGPTVMSYVVKHVRYFVDSPHAPPPVQARYVAEVIVEELAGSLG